MFQLNSLSELIKQNWKSGLTVALISVPLSIAISIASGAGPIPGVITGIWGTAIASIFGGSNFNIIGAAGALTTVLFAATLAAPLGLGAGVLPLLAIGSGALILVVWALGADRFLYYVPSSVMYGFAAGVAILIAASQMFDATGLSTLKRTGTFLGDVSLLSAHVHEFSVPTIAVFAIALAFILLWKRFVKALPAVIPVSVLGIIFGALNATAFHIPVLSLGDKFGTFVASLTAPVAWNALPQMLAQPETLMWFIKASALIALIGILETLITAKIGDKITKTQSSSQKELLGLGLANLGAGAAGGLPATGVFIRAGANIRAGATHRMSAFIAAAATGAIALMVLPYFAYIPVAVIAAILINTAIGLIETEKVHEFWHYEKSAFAIFMLVALVTVLEDAGIAVLVGAVAALLVFADSVSRGRFDATLAFADGSYEKLFGATTLRIRNEKPLAAVTYSIAGSVGYIDAERHAANFRTIAESGTPAVIIRLRDLFSLDLEAQDMLAEAVLDLTARSKKVFVSSARPEIVKELQAHRRIAHTLPPERFTAKTEDALRLLGVL